MIEDHLTFVSNLWIYGGLTLLAFTLPILILQLLWGVWRVLSYIVRSAYRIATWPIRVIGRRVFSK